MLRFSSALLNTATLKHRKIDVGVVQFMATEPVILIPRQTHRPARDLLECAQRAAIWTGLPEENHWLRLLPKALSVSDSHGNSLSIRRYRRVPASGPLRCSSSLKSIGNSSGRWLSTIRRSCIKIVLTSLRKASSGWSNAKLRDEKVW